MAEQKLEGSATCFTFLGFELDTRQMVCKLLPNKLKELKELVVEWLPGEHVE